MLGQSGLGTLMISPPTSRRSVSPPSAQSHWVGPPEFSWVYAKLGRLYHWYPRAWEWRLGKWGRWWEVWVETAPEHSAPLQGGFFDGEGFARRQDKWRWRPVGYWTQ